MIKISLLGDVALNGLFVLDNGKNKLRFRLITKILQDNYVFCNLETPIKDGNFLSPNKRIHLFTNEETLREVLPLLNIKFVSLANNHIGDCGLKGVKKTIEVLDDLKIKYTGAGFKKKHLEPVIIEVDNNKIGFIAYVHKNTHPNVEDIDDLLLNYFDEEIILKTISELKSKVDLIICSLHWGNDYSRFFTKEQQIIARRLIESGTDIIMGHHTHTYQSFEVYKGKLIFYSLGQLSFGDFNREGELRALKRKTKTAYSIVLNTNLQIDKFIKTKELKGNFIKVYNKNNFIFFNKVLYKMNLLSNKNHFARKMLNIKESVFDRIIEYFFGYYRNPVKQLFTFRNFNKISFLKRDMKKY